MGVVWGSGSRYDGFYGTVLWVLLTLRSSNNFQVLYNAASLRDLPNRVLAGDDPYTPPTPDPAWSVDADNRVMAWNGGASDLP